MGATAAPITLTDEQQRAVDLLLKVVADGGEGALQGPAGTGKTTTIRALLGQLDPTTTLIVCPTHKARRECERGLAGVRTTTCASLLRLSPRICSTTGKTIFREDPEADPLEAAALRNAPLPKVLICDESSMITARQADGLAAVARQLGCPLLFVGDPAQLPPVDERGGGMSPRFTKAERLAVLTNVMRTADGPVLGLSVDLRNCRHPSEVWPTTSRRGADSAVIVHNTRESWFAAAHRAIADPRWRDDPDRARCVAWRHCEADAIATQLRQMLFGAEAQGQWFPGEWLSCVRGLPQPGGALAPPLAAANAELLIEAVGPLQVLAQHRGSFEWRTPVRGWERTVELAVETVAHQLTVLDRWSGHRHQVWVEPPAASGQWARQVKDLRALVREHVHDREQREELLEAVADLQTYCPWLRPAVSGTIHSSQGSSYDATFVAGDLTWCQHGAERLAYVAVTRSRLEAHVMRMRNRAVAAAPLSPAAAC